MTTTASIIGDSLKLFQEHLRAGEAPSIAEQIVQDEMSERLGSMVVIEEPMCCDALPRVDWLHHSCCPEVKAHHAQHTERHSDCPTCNVQRRVEDRIG